MEERKILKAKKRKGKISLRICLISIFTLLPCFYSARATYEAIVSSKTSLQVPDLGDDKDPGDLVRRL